GQKCPLGVTQTPRILSCCLVGEAVGFEVRWPQRHGREFAVRGAVELDGKAPAFGVDAGHGGPRIRTRRSSGYMVDVGRRCGVGVLGSRASSGPAAFQDLVGLPSAEIPE